MFELIRAYQKRDPAATNPWEVFFLYPGYKAMAFHRVAHAFYRGRVPFLPRLTSEIGRFLTGIEIHPGAQIGRRFVIDHGTGVVIGETAIIGDDVLIYQGSTLGGRSFLRGKRHPTVGDRVIIGAGARVLGNVTVGHDAKVGANSVVLTDVPPGATAVGAPARLIPGR